jgi:hypothetical protein
VRINQHGNVIIMLGEPDARRIVEASIIGQGGILPPLRPISRIVVNTSRCPVLLTHDLSGLQHKVVLAPRWNSAGFRGAAPSKEPSSLPAQNAG